MAVSVSGFADRPLPAVAALLASPDRLLTPVFFSGLTPKSEIANGVALTSVTPAGRVSRPSANAPALFAVLSASQFRQIAFFSVVGVAAA